MKNSESPELKPCPFCGGEAEKVSRFMMGYIGDGVKCKRCFSETPKHLVEQDAISRWNRRILPEDMALVPREITAETGHKAGMIGDFTERWRDHCSFCYGSGLHEDDGEECEACEGSGVEHRTTDISWTTIKAIHKRIVEISEAS